MSSGIGKAALAGIRWNYLGFFARSGSNFLIGIFLARLLGPKPFGQLASATLVVGIANLVADAGFTSALIQAPNLTALQIRYVFTIQFVTAIGMTLGCAAVSGTVARAFHDPAVRAVLIGISPLFVLGAFGQTSNALLRRDLAFKTLQTLQMLSYFVGYLAVGIPLAFLGAGVWSLVSAQLVQAALYAALLYARVRHPLAPTLDRSGAVLLRFGAKVTIGNLVNYGIGNADNFFVGHAFGSTSLGFYNRAFTLGSSPADGVVNTLQQVLFSACSRAEGRIDSIRRAYLACLPAVGFVILPAFWAVAACSSSVMVGLYGEQWRPAAPLLAPLVLAISIHTLMAMAGPILGSLDLVEREVQAQGLTLVVTIAAFWLAARHSTLAVAWAVCGVYCFRFLAVTWPTLRVLKLRWRDVLRVLGGPAAVGLFTAGATRAVDLSLRPLHLASAATMVLLLLAGCVSVAAAVMLTGRLTLPAEFASVLRPSMGSAPQALTRLIFGDAPALPAAAAEIAIEQGVFSKGALGIDEELRTDGKIEGDNCLVNVDGKEAR